MSQLSVGQLRGLTVNNNVISVPSGHKIYQGGSVVNIYTARYSENFTTSSTSFVDVPNLSITFTPISSSSAFFIILSTSRASTRASNLDFASVMRVLRNNSDNVAINGTLSGNRQPAAMVFNGFSYNSDHNPGGYSISAVDYPSTSSSLTYKVQVRVQSSTYPLTLNGVNNDGNTSETYHSRGQTSMTIMEIAQ